MRWSRLVAPILVLLAVNLTACGGIRPPGQGLESNGNSARSSPSAFPVSSPSFGSINWAKLTNHAGDYPGGLSFEERGLRPGAQVTINL
jgi:hypothetical protein